MVDAVICVKRPFNITDDKGQLVSGPHTHWEIMVMVEDIGTSVATSTKEPLAQKITKEVAAGYGMMEITPFLYIEESPRMRAMEKAGDELDNASYKIGNDPRH